MGKDSLIKSTTKPTAKQKTITRKKAETTQRKIPEVNNETAAEHPPEKSEMETSTCAGHPPSIDEPPPDPLGKMITYGIAVLVFLVVLVIIASFVNTGNYYIKSNQGAIEIWQGKFAPKGTKRVISLPGMQVAESIKPVYTENEITPLICRYYIDKADMLLDVPGMPDFEGVKMYLIKAQDYATAIELNQEIQKRLDALNLMVLMFKADLAAGNETVASLEKALGYLKKAQAHKLNDLQAVQIKQKIDAISSRIENLKSKMSQ